MFDPGSEIIIISACNNKSVCVCVCVCSDLGTMGPSIHDVHTEGAGVVRLRWTHVDGGRGSSPMWTSTQKNKIRAH